MAAYDGGFAVIWSSSQTGGSSFDIYLQRFNNDGIAQGAEQRVSNAVGLTTAQTGAQYYGDIAAQANGDLFVVWNDNGSNDGSSDGVFGRLYNANTGTFGSTFLVNTATSGSQSNASIGYEPRVAALANGGYVVVWPDSTKDGSRWGVFGQRFAADGSSVSTEFRKPRL